MKLQTCFLLFFTFISCSNPPEAESFLNPEIDALFSEWNSQGSPGCALAVIQNGEIIYKKGYGMADLEHNIPIQPSTVFYCGSVSKQFVTLSILLLEEQGKLNLDDDIRKYFTDFPDYGDTITIRNLIHHTSGIRDYLTLWDLTGRDYLDHISKHEVYELIKRQKELNFVPGDRYLYSNSCYFMLAELVKMISGETLKDFAAKNIFEPLEMTNSHFHDNYRHLIPNRAFSYAPDGANYSNLIMRFDQVGSGGLYSSVEDLFLWDQNFYHNKLGKGSQSLIDKMHEEGTLNSGASAGYAFALVNGNYRGLRTVSHTGSLAGYRAVLTRFPDEHFSVIILSNLASFNPAGKAEEVAEIYLEDKMINESDSGSEVEGESGSEVEENTPEITDLLIFQGRYFSEELEVYYTLSSEENKLFFAIGNLEPRPLVPAGKDRFSGEDGYPDFRFQKNSQGLVKGFVLDAGRVTNLKFTKVD
jgi:CubicO group peptidase (beta-lactamase class C family)